MPLVYPAHGTSLDLGIANEFSGFVLGDLNAAGGDTEGRLAVMGDLNFTGQWGSYSVGFGRLGMGDTQTNPVLAVGGTVNGSIVVDGQSAIGVDNPINFASADTFLKSQSTFWSTLGTNGSASSLWGTLTLTGTHDDLNIFNISADQWSNSHTKNIHIAEGSRALINISGQNVSNSGGLALLSGKRDQVLFNFYEAISIAHQGLAFEGSVLSPFADWNASGGGINGVGILGSLTGTNGFEFHDFDFNGQGTAAPVPETATIVLLGLGLLGLAKIARNRFT